jgi:hypothetical protein
MVAHDVPPVLLLSLPLTAQMYPHLVLFSVPASVSFSVLELYGREKGQDWRRDPGLRRPGTGRDN